MHLTHPSYIQADNLSFKQSLKVMSNHDYLLYSSLWMWWKKTTSFWGLPLLIVCILIYLSFFFAHYVNGHYTDTFLFTTAIAVSFVPIMFTLPFFWALSYYFSFIAPKVVTKRIKKLLDNDIPDATNIICYSPTSYTFERNGIEYELTYTNLPEKSQNGNVKKEHACFIICVYYAPKPSTRLLWFDENAYMRDEFISAFKVYCNGKEACRHLELQDYAMFAVFDAKEHKATNDVTRSLDEMEYLLSKFSLLPLIKSWSYMQRAINTWLKGIDSSAPEGIAAINIRVLKTECGYGFYISGARHSDNMNYGWTCNKDFIPENDCLEINTGELSANDQKYFQQMTAKFIENYINKYSIESTSLFHDMIVTLNHGDYNMVRIK